MNFWRSISNLTINVAGKGGCQFGEFWATSQATSLRRVNVNGKATLMDYCSGPSYASGGFIADSQFSGTVINGSQQQWFVRNSNLGGWSNGVWNQVFAGVNGAPAQSFGTAGGVFTTLATNPESREKPFLYLDPSGKYRVYVPNAQFNALGATWTAGQTPGHSIPIGDFFIAKPTDSVQAINNALAQGKNLIFTPGIYNVSRTIEVKRPDTIVLGMGLATIVPQHGVVPMKVADVKGVEISNLIFDAGPVNSPVLLQVGTEHASNGQAREHNHWSDPADPTALQDVYFRIGGAHVGKATVSLEVNSQQRHPRQHLGLAGRPRHGRRLDEQHRRYRRDRERRQRDRHRPVRRALPEGRGHLERPERQDHLLPERDAVRPAEPGRLDSA